MLLFPGFQLLDVAGPLDILNTLSIQVPKSTSSLAALTPSAAQITLTMAAESAGPVPTKPPHSSSFNGNTSFSNALHATHSFSQLLPLITSGSHPVDVLYIPGGFGTRLPDPDSPYSLAAQRFTAAIAKHVKVAIVTVCTGADVLAQTGLLQGRRATTNKFRYDYVADRNPGVEWVKRARWVKSPAGEGEGEGGKGVEIWSSAGVSAGMDVTWAFVTEKYGGIEVARHLAKILEYDWKEVGDGEDDTFYEAFFGKD